MENDIIQVPKEIRIEDIPTSLSLNVPFYIKGDQYICEIVDSVKFQTCERITEEETSVPIESGNYYRIRRSDIKRIVS
jgi:hypothetical protein